MGVPLHSRSAGERGRPVRRSVINGNEASADCQVKRPVQAITAEAGVNRPIRFPAGAGRGGQPSGEQADGVGGEDGGAEHGERGGGDRGRGLRAGGRARRERRPGAPARRRGSGAAVRGEFLQGAAHPRREGPGVGEVGGAGMRGRAGVRPRDAAGGGARGGRVGAVPGTGRSEPAAARAGGDGEQPGGGRGGGRGRRRAGRHGGSPVSVRGGSGRIDQAAAVAVRSRANQTVREAVSPWVPQAAESAATRASPRPEESQARACFGAIRGRAEPAPQTRTQTWAARSSTVTCSGRRRASTPVRGQAVLRTSPWIKALVTSSLVSRAAVQWVSAGSARRTRETYSRAVRTSPSRRPGRNSVVTSGWKPCVKDTGAHLEGGRKWHARYGRDYSEAQSTAMCKSHLEVE